MPGRPTNEPANYFAIGKQSAKDAEATTFYFLRHLDGTALERDDNIESVREGGDGQEVGLRYRTAVSQDGQLVANARPEIAGRLFAYLLGRDSVAGGAGAASAVTQQHTSTPTALGPSSPYYLTVEQAWADEVERVSNAKVNELTIEGEAGRPLKLTAGLLAGGTPYFPTAAQSPTRETDQPFFFPNGSYVIDGAANTKLTKFRVNVKRGVDGDIRTTSLHREDVVELNFDVEFEGTLKYEDKTLYRKVHALGGSQVPLNALDLATGSFVAHTDFGVSTLRRFLQVHLPVFQYTGARVNKLDPDGKTMYIDFSAMGIKGATHQIWTLVQAASGGAF